MNRYIIWLVIIVLIMVVLLAWREREHCPLDEVWVMTDQGWLCMPRSRS